MTMIRPGMPPAAHPIFMQGRPGVQGRMHPGPVYPGGSPGGPPRMHPGGLGGPTDQPHPGPGPGIGDMAAQYAQVFHDMRRGGVNQNQMQHMQNGHLPGMMHGDFDQANLTPQQLQLIAQMLQAHLIGGPNRQFSPINRNQFGQIMSGQMQAPLPPPPPGHNRMNGGGPVYMQPLGS